MKAQMAAIAAVLILLPVAQSAAAQEVPAWIKSNAGWWAEGKITEAEFVSAIQFLIDEKILSVPPVEAAAQQSEGIPEWVKSNALWWSQDLISDGEFVNGIRHLMSIGAITIGAPGEEADAATPQDDSRLAALEAELDACAEIKRAYDRLNCQGDAKDAIVAHNYRTAGQAHQVGPVTFYYTGSGLEVISSGQALLDISMLAENTGSDENITMLCTGPAICSYDVWDGERAFKYSGMDFTNGQIVLKPGQATEFSMLFGPNIGYGGTKFEYDSAKDYFFRVQESWGSADIPLMLR